MKASVLLALALATASAPLMAAVKTSVPQQIFASYQGAPFVLQSVGSGTCLTSSSRVAACDAADPGQQWTVVLRKGSSTYKLQNVKTGDCLGLTPISRSSLPANLKVSTIECSSKLSEWTTKLDKGQTYDTAPFTPTSIYRGLCLTSPVNQDSAFGMVCSTRYPQTYRVFEGG